MKNADKKLIYSVSYSIKPKKSRSDQHNQWQPMATNNVKAIGINLQSMLRIHLPFKMAIRTFSVLVHAPCASVAAITCVTFGFQNLVTVAPNMLANLTTRICIGKYILKKKKNRNHMT